MTCSRTWTATAQTEGRSGQSLLESCVAIALISLIFFGLVQVARLFAAREILAYAAARAVRARTVGFNAWMTRKAVLVAAIPNAGRMVEPAFEHVDTPLRMALTTHRPGGLWDEVLRRGEPVSEQYAIERARIPEFLASGDGWQARYVLDYEDWDTVDGPAWGGDPGSSTGTLLVAHVNQDYPLWVPMHRLFYAADSVRLRAESALENHFPLYLEDYGW